MLRRVRTLCAFRDLCGSNDLRGMGMDGLCGYWRNANANNELPAAIVTYCLPLTE
jgi:hypothetical protein